MHKTLIFLATLFATLALGLVASRQHRLIASLGSEIESLRVNRKQATSLQKEHQRLAAERESLGDLTSLRRAHGQSAVLRAAIARLKRQTQDLASAPSSRIPPVKPIWPQDAPVLSATEWKFAGNESPSSTMESVLWSAREGDTERMAGLLDFGPGDRQRMEQLLASLPPESRAQYGSAENLVATLVAASIPTDYEAVAPYHESRSDHQALMTLRVEQAGGQQQDLPFMFHAGPGGWKLDVPGSVMAGFERQLKSK